jgi:hypothetical protein
MGLIGLQRTYHADRPATSAERQRVFARKRRAEWRRFCQQYSPKVYHQSNTVEWATPQTFYEALDAAFHFTLDVAAHPPALTEYDVFLTRLRHL